MQWFRARWLLPVSAPPVADAALVTDAGRIVEFGPWSEVRQARPTSSCVRDLGDTVIAPGLINSHTHLELSWVAEQRSGTTPDSSRTGPPGSSAGRYLEWLRELLDWRANEPQTAAVAAAQGAIRELERRGTVAVGDIENSPWMAGLLAESDLAGVAFHEIYGLRDEHAAARFCAACETIDAIERSGKQPTQLRQAVTLHAPHTTAAAWIQRVAERSRAQATPLSVHVAESREESQMLAGTGPYPSFFHERDFWDDAWRVPHATSVAYLETLGVLSPDLLAVHAVQVTEDDIELLGRRGVCVVTCPRSNHDLDVGIAPVPRMLDAGVQVALGTDSLASAPDLDLWRELAFLRHVHPTLAPSAALRMATLAGAQALGLADRLGSIDYGKHAKLVAVPLATPGDDPLEWLTSGPRDVFPLTAAPWEACPC